MKKITQEKIIQGTKVIILGLLFSVLIATAAPWQGPSALPPQNNVDAPINAGSVEQTKAGRLNTLGLFRGNGNVIVGGNATTPQDPWNLLNLAVYQPGTPPIKGGQLVQNGIIGAGAEMLTGGQIVGELSKHYSTDGVTEPNATVLYPAHLCTDVSGHLVICNAPVTASNTQIYTFSGGSQTTSGSLGTGNPNSFTPPAGATNIIVKMWGAGGGGGNYAAPKASLIDCIQNCIGGLPPSGDMSELSATTTGLPDAYADGLALPGGSGGGGGAYYQFNYTSTAPITISVGAGGTAGDRIDAMFNVYAAVMDVLNGNNGGPGGSTTVGSYTVAGGSGGHGAAYSHNPSTTVKDVFAGAAGGPGIGQAGHPGDAGTKPAIATNYACVKFGGPAAGGLSGNNDSYGKGGKGGGGGGGTTGGGTGGGGGTGALSTKSNTASAVLAQLAGCSQAGYSIGEAGQPGRVEITWDL